MRLALASFVLSFAAACTAILGNDFVIVQGESGGGVSTAGSGGTGAEGGGGGMGGAGGGVGGAGGMTPQTMLSCAPNDATTRLISDGTNGPWDRKMFVERQSNETVRLVAYQDGGGPIHLFDIDTSDTGTVAPFSYNANKLLDVKRIDGSQIGILSSAVDPGGTYNGIYIRQVLDNDSDGSSTINTALTPDDIFAQSDGDLNAIFLPEGDGGGSNLGTIRYSVTFLNTTDNQYRSMFAVYAGTAVTPFVYTSPDPERNVVKAGQLHRDGNRTHAFSIDLPQTRQFIIDDGVQGVVAPRLLPMNQVVGDIVRTPNGDMNVSGGLFALPDVEGFMGVLADGTLADLDISMLTSSGVKSGNDIQGGDEVSFRWANDNFVALGPTVGDNTTLVLRITHVSGQSRGEASYALAGGLGTIPSGGTIKGVAAIARNPDLFGTFNDAIHAVLLMDLGGTDRIYYVQIDCTVE